MSKILRRAKVLEVLGWSSSTLDRRVRAGLFPQPVRLGTNSVGWLEDEVSAYVEKLASSRKSKVAASETANA